MTLPDRPVDDAEIATDWGQAVHDYVFAPKGCDLTTATTRVVNATAGGQHCHLDVATDDPGGFLDAPNDQAVVPTGGEGLYLIDLALNTVNGTAGDQTRAYIYINGVQWKSGIEDNAGGVNVSVTVTGMHALVAGDIITVTAQKKGSGTNPTVKVTSLQLVRLGAELGA